MPNDIHWINHIPLQLPRERIWSRLGANRHLTVLPQDQRKMIENCMQDAFALCRPRGVWRTMKLAGHYSDRVVLCDGSELPSSALAELLCDASSVWLAAASVGADLSTAVMQHCELADGVSSLVYDAVGGEAADAALGWLQQFCTRELLRGGARLATRRFSPGYGDLDLSCQRIIFKLLDLENWGLRLTETLLMIPEKSVTAFAGVEE